MIWPTVALGDVSVSIRNGIFARRPTDEPGGSRILRISAVRDGRVNLDDSRFVDGLEAAQVSKFSINPGDLLMTRYNGSRSLVGISGLVPEHSKPVIHPDKLIRIVLDTGRILPAFANYQLSSPTVRAHLEPRIRTTAGQSGIAGADVRSIPLAVPSLDEQRRIVDLLEDHLSRLDAAEESIRRSLGRLLSLRDAALSQAVEFAFASSDVKVETIGDLAKVSSGLTPLKGNKAFYEGGTIPWITSGDLHQGLITEAKHFVTQAALDETTLKLVPAGAILIAMYGEGKTRGTAAELGIDATTNQACAAVVLHESDLRPWVRLILDANYSRLRRLAAGGVQPNLNQAMVKAIEIAIPVPGVRSDLLAQRAEFDDARLRLQSQLATARLRGARLRRSLLAAAFSGRLTGDREVAGV
jgi:type I restriction enzyme, S subunit